ncbi:MAG: CotH kinase family protein [Putridiphycobacter sp.]
MKIGLVLLVFILSLWGCQTSSSGVEGNEIIYQSGAEIVDGEYLTDSTGQFKFKSSKQRTDEVSRTGKYSVKLDSNSVYGYSITLDDIKEGELFQISAWQKEGSSHGTLICSVEGKNNYILRTYYNDYVPQDGWIHHKLDFVADRNVEALTIYVYAGKHLAYFDDFEIRRLTTIPSIDYQTKLNLYIPDSSQQLLDMYIENSISSATIKDEYKAYVPAFMILGADTVSIDMRLKGDWTDHLVYGKPSYRIKVKGNYAFQGLKTFSIQHVKTRNYMHEWFVHKWFDKEDLLSTTFDFTEVNINGQNKGVYAFEEHFDKQLLESRNRREGPILKLDEGGFWNIVAYQKQHPEFEKALPYFAASLVSMFKKGRTLKNKVLKHEFLEGANLLTLFKNQFDRPEQLFDIKRVAKFYALIDATNSYHSLAWHNRRFYFNPVIQKLEHIGFDMLPGTEMNYPLSIESKIGTEFTGDEFALTRPLILNKTFKQHYLSYMETFTDESYISALLEQLNSEIKQREDLIKIETYGYTFDTAFYYQRAKIIRNKLADVNVKWDQLLVAEANGETDEIAPKHYEPFDGPIRFDGVSVNAYRSKIDSGVYQLEIENYHLNDIRLLGYETKLKKGELIKFDTPKPLPKFDEVKGMSDITLVLNEKPRAIYYVTDNNPGEVVHQKVIKWAKPKGGSTRMKFENKRIDYGKYGQLKDSVFTFKSGEHQIKDLLFIPEKYKVVVPKGTAIDFVEDGGLIINNSFYCEGDSLNPIRFYSSDGQNNGVTVLQVPEVKMSYVIADSLNRLHEDCWDLTGGITIYESEVEMSHCTVKNNTAEDALNIIRSNFNITNLTVENTYSDGFDADFCTGSISHSSFTNTGNDCIDFSGSVVDISDIKIKHSGDKGISGGERSTLTLHNIDINGAITGVAAKDDTKISGGQISVKNAEYGLAAFQKKAEYDNAQITLTEVVYDQIMSYGLLDKGSVVHLNGHYFIGTVILDIDALYARFEK